jgi:hypothetical protein
MNHHDSKLIALICAASLSCAAYAQNNAPQPASPTTTGSGTQTVTAPANPSGTPNPDVIPDPNQTSPAASMPTQTEATPAQANPQLNAPNPPATANVPASVPPVDAGSAASRPNMAPGNTPPPVTVASAGSNNPTQVFTALDVGRKGYLSQPDVAVNPFLASNFQKCDVNSETCRRVGSSIVALCDRWRVPQPPAGGRLISIKSGACARRSMTSSGSASH